MTQRDLGLYLNVAPSTITQWEAAGREPNLSILIELAEFFSVSTDYLLGRTDKPLEQRFGKNTVEIEPRPVPINRTEPTPELMPVSMTTDQRMSGKSTAIEKTLTGIENREQLEALVRQMIEEALKSKQDS